MGNVCGSGEAKKSEMTKKIDTETKELQEMDRGQVKILLLGTGESGKSTIFKQMKILQDDGGFTKEELSSYRDQIHANCLAQMRCIIEAVISLRQPLQHKESLDNAQQIIKINREVKWSKDLGDMIKSLWTDSGIIEVFDKRGKLYQLNDTAQYFFDNIDRINEENYVPTEQDVLRVRVRSTGVDEAEFIFDKKKFKVIDVGGQRSERRKWIHCFDLVTAVLFCASLADYDLPLREDPRQNRLSEAMMLFAEVSNQESFLNKSIIVFLNKTDLLREKLPTHPLELWRADYQPPQSNDPEEHYNQASQFIKKLFLSEVNENTRSPTSIYTHYTCALDKENIAVVIKAVRIKLLQDLFDSFGFV